MAQQQATPAMAAAGRLAVFGAIVIPGITARLPERPAPASEVLQE
jgi:hypothetical protein